MLKKLFIYIFLFLDFNPTFAFENKAIAPIVTISHLWKVEGLKNNYNYKY